MLWSGGKSLRSKSGFFCRFETDNECEIWMIIVCLKLAEYNTPV